MSMRAILAGSLLILAALASARAYAFGDLGISSLAQQGRHHELIEDLAPSVRKGEDVSSFRLMLLGGAYFEVGRYQDALETADRLEKRILAGDRSYFGGDLSVYPAIIRGSVALDQGLYLQAIGHGSDAAGRLEPGQIFHRAQLISTGNMLGVAHALAGNPAEARRHLETVRSVDASMSNLGPEKFTAMARIQMALKDFAGALASVTEPEADVSAVLTLFYDPTFQNVPRHFIRSRSLLETGQVEKAKRGFDDLLKHPQLHQYGTLYWIVLQDRARIALAEGDVPLALELMQRAIEVIEQRRSSISTDAGRIGFVGDKQAVYAALIRALISRGDARAAFEYAERSRSRALVDMLASKQDFSIASGRPGKVRELLATATRVEAEAGSSGGNPDKPTSTRSVNLAWQQVGSESPELASLVSVSALSAAEVQSLISPGETLVAYYMDGEDLIAFIVTARALKVVRLDGAGLAEAIRQFRRQLENVATDRYLPLSQGLYDRLFRPVSGQVEGERLAIVAHGPLHYLPFNALHDGQRFLIDRHALRLLPSASVLKYVRAQAVAKPGEILALGNPDLGNPSMDLANAQAEAIAVAKGRQSKVLLGKEANEAAVRQHGGGFRYIHFATHGLFNPEAPLKSALLLARDAGSDGLLTVDKVYSMRLDADLVTLSACETGLGKIASGDDVVGLSRGFLYAGSRSIVASLWKVDDLATSRLMQRFYDHLERGNKRDALRQAQRETMKEYPHPFFWAAFQLTGSAM